MSGTKGRSGGHNRKSTELHILTGTYRPDRHGPKPPVAQLPAGQPQPVDDADHSALARLHAYQALLAELLTGINAETATQETRGIRAASGRLKVVFALEEKIRNLEDRFGLNPAARARLGGRGDVDPKNNASWLPPEIRQGPPMLNRHGRPKRYGPDGKCTYDPKDFTD